MSTDNPPKTVSLPSIDDAGKAAVQISEAVIPKLDPQEQAYFIAGFQECIKWLHLQPSAQ